MAIHRNHQFNLIKLSSSILSLLFITTLALLTMQPNTSAVSSSVNASVKVASACSITGGSNNYSDTIANSETKTFGPSNIKATCNDTGGYSLYAIGYSGDSYSGNNTKMIGTNSSISTATSGTDSYWAMQVLPVAGTYAPTIMNSFDSGSFHVIPDTYAQIAKYTSITDAGDSATGSNLQVSYKVSISATQGVDTYTGKVKYTLVHPNNAAAPATPLPESACSASQICYAPNAGDIDGSMSSMGTVTGSSTAGKQTGVATNGTAVLRAPNFSRDGYGFAGWSTDFEATSSSVVFGPNQTITTATDGAGDADVSQHGLILYPVWIASTGDLQSWTGCSSLTTAPKPSSGNTPTLASMTALTDTRDNNTYAVARLSDGNCWMVENLRLNESVSASLISSGSQGIGGDFTALPNSENANFSNSTTANNLYNTGNAYTMPRYNSNNTNRSLTASYSGTGSSTYYQWYSYGNYYTWNAAMANTNSLTSYSASESARTSLCPTGWHIPTGGDKTRITTDNNNEFWNLIVVNLNNNTLPANYDSSSSPYYNGSTEAGPVDKLIRAFPNNFVYSGNFNTASAYSRGSSGYYRSSSADASNYAYYLHFTSTGVYPGTSNNGKYYGRTVRCLLSS